VAIGDVAGDLARHRAEEAIVGRLVLADLCGLAGEDRQAVGIVELYLDHSRAGDDLAHDCRDAGLMGKREEPGGILAPRGDDKRAGNRAQRVGERRRQRGIVLADHLAELGDRAGLVDITEGAGSAQEHERRDRSENLGQ
jgi:hypothetical protein